MEARARVMRASGTALAAFAWAAAGTAVAFAIGWYISPRWPELCSAFSYRATACAPIGVVATAGYAMTVQGLLLMIAGPLATALWHLFRNGYDWESSRVEPAYINVPIIYGIAYFGGGIALATIA